MDDEPKYWRFFALFGVGGIVLSLSVLFIEVLWPYLLILAGAVGLGWLVRKFFRWLLPLYKEEQRVWEERRREEERVRQKQWDAIQAYEDKKRRVRDRLEAHHLTDNQMSRLQGGIKAWTTIGQDDLQRARIVEFVRTGQRVDRIALPDTWKRELRKSADPVDEHPIFYERAFIYRRIEFELFGEVMDIALDEKTKLLRQ